MSEPSEPLIELDHPRFTRAEIAVFTRRVVADCMSHACTIRETGEVKLDACCQYGCDVDLIERDAILARADQIRPILAAEVRDLPWFDESAPEQDPDTPSGTVVRTAVHDDGCLFLAHDKRGCAIHRASLEQGWDFRGTKPAICRLFPLTYGDGAIFVSDDYPDYSCAYEPGAPTLYRVAREALADLFGDDLVRAMDAAEATILASEPKRLPVVQSQASEL
jgi:Fe-S-cluster containining protein